jgi:hypothetical protein
MVKYYFVLLLVMGAVFYYIFQVDPCNKNLRADFAKEYPGYKILDSGSREGSPEEVQCHIRYEKPGSEQVYEDVWSYRNSESGWIFSSVLTTGEAIQTP